MTQRDILVVDVGGSHRKMLATGHRKRLKPDSGSKTTAREMVRAVQHATKGCRYSAVSIGYPRPFLHAGSAVSHDSHSIAIRTSERARLADPRVRTRGEGIIKTQRQEIDEMKAWIRDLESHR